MKKNDGFSFARIIKSKYSILFFIILIALIPRSIELISQNYLFGFDQGVFYEDVKDIVINHNPTLIGTEVGGAGGFFQGPGWYYLLAIPFVFTGGDPYGGMVLMVLLGVATAVLAYFVFRSTHGKVEGMVASLLIAISPSIITQARFIWPPFPITFLAVVFLYCFYRVLQKRGNYFPFLTFSLGMMTHFETATAATLLINFALFLPLFFIKKLISWKNALAGAGTLIFTQIALIVFDVRNDFLNIRGIIKLASGTNGEYLLQDVVDNRWQVLKENFIGTFPGGEYLWPFLLTFILLGAYLYLKDKKHEFSQKAFVVYLIATPIMLFIIFILYKGLMWGWWILELNVYYIALVAILSGFLWKKKLAIGVILLLGVMATFFIHSTINFYKNDFHDFGGVHKIKGKLQAIDYIYQDANGKPFNIQIFTPPVYHRDYDYLFWWHGLKNYGYLPEYKKEGTVYLLIEPDPHKPWTYQGWLETVIKEGEVVFSTTLPKSGFVIQKRIIKE